MERVSTFAASSSTIDDAALTDTNGHVYGRHVMTKESVTVSCVYSRILIYAIQFKKHGVDL